MRMTDVEIEPQPRETRFVHERAQVRRRTHFAGRVLDADRHTEMLRVKDQMLERTERGGALTELGRGARSTRVKHHAREGYCPRDIDSALEFVHRFDAAYTL